MKSAFLSSDLLFVRDTIFLIDFDSKIYAS